MSRPIRLALLLIGLSSFAAALFIRFDVPQSVTPPPAESTPAAGAASRLMALTLPDLTGNPQPLAQWKGQVLVVNFWATWCPPCREEMPEFSQISDKFRDKGVKFIGISIDSAEKVVEFQKRIQVSYPLLIGSSELLELTQSLGNQAKGLPFTVVLDRLGEPIRLKLGKFPQAELEQTIEAGLARKKL